MKPFCESGNITICLLRAHDERVLGELAVGFRLDVEARAARHVIGNDRRMDVIGNIGIMPDQACLGGFVIIGSNDEQTINSCFSASLER